MQEAFRKTGTQSCEACGLSMPSNVSRILNDRAAGTNRLCTSCARVCYLICLELFFHVGNLCVLMIACYLQLKKMKHYCGICKEIKNQSDSRTWVG